MIVDRKEITQAEIVRLIELLGGSVESRSEGAARWRIGDEDGVLYGLRDRLSWGYIDREFAVLVADRLAALPKKRVGFYVQSHFGDGEGVAIRVSIIDYARPGRPRFEGDSTNLAEAILTAAFRWARATMEE